MAWFVYSSRVSLALIACMCIMAAMSGCDQKQNEEQEKRQGTSRTQILSPSFSDDEISSMKISILWYGPTNKPAPGIILTVDGKDSSPEVMSRFRPIVQISSDEAKDVLSVIVPIYETNQDIKEIGYVVRIETHQRQLEFPLGPDRKPQAEILKAISDKVNAKAKSVMAPMIAYVSY